MQWLGLIILIGILALLLIAALYLGKTQKTPSLPSPSITNRNASHHREGMVNALKTLQKLDERSPREHRRHAQGKQRQRQQKHKWDD